jgi:hypothetical protein
MPRYYYPKLRPLIQAFAEENNLPFKVSGVLEIVKLNYEVLRRFAAESADTAPIATSLPNQRQESPVSKVVEMPNI